MDFHSLNRRQLQSLCKLNKIPANITNVAMADALRSLQTVEGIEEFFNPVPSETAELPNEMPEKNELMSPVTSSRTSTRPKAKKTYADFVPATTTRGVRKQVTVEADDGLKTQAVASTRNKASETFSCQTVASQDTVKKEETTVQRAYSTRRSTRLTEKKCVETGVMDREASQPVKIGSFLEEEDSGNLVSEKSLGSETSHESDISSENTKDSVAEGSVESFSNEKVEDICFIETSHESDISSENTKDSVAEGSVESFSKEKVEDICNAFDNVDLEERQNEGDKFVPNKVDNSEEENAYVGSEEHSDSLLSDKASFVSEANSNDTPSSELEDMSYVVSEMKNETLESSGSANMAGDFIHLNSENPSELSKLDNTDGHNVAKEVTEEGMDFGPPAEEERVNISKIDAVLVDFLNPKESSMNFEAPVEEEKDDTAVDMDADKVTQESSMNFEAPVEEEKDDTALDMDADKVTQESSMNFEAPAEEEKEDTAVDMDADKVSQESAADNANDAIDHPIHLSSMKQQTIRDGPTSLKGMTMVDNDENSVTELQGATVEDNRSVHENAGDEKPKSITELSLRQLKKQLKALTIKSNSNTNKDDMVAEARPALQVVCNNQMAIGEDN